MKNFVKIFQGVYLSIVILFILFKFNKWSFVNDKIDLYFVFFLSFGFFVFVLSLYVYKNKYLRISLTTMIILIMISLYFSRGIIGLSYSMLIDEISNNDFIIHKALQNREFIVKKYKTGSFAHTYQYIGLYEKKFISLEKKLLMSQMADLENEEEFRYRLREEKGNIVFSTEYNGVKVDSLVLK